MENQVRANSWISGESKKKNQKIKVLLYSEDFDFAQSFSLYFNKDFKKIVTVNDREVLIQIVKSIQPEIIVIDSPLNLSLLKCIDQIKTLSSSSKIFIFTSHTFVHQDIAKQIQRMVDKIFFQPIDLVEFNQVLNFYTAD
jgi:ActR/RegA family two-component response regulator